MPASNQHDALQAWIREREAEYKDMKRAAVDEALDALSRNADPGYLSVLAILTTLYDAAFSAGYAQLMEQS